MSVLARIDARAKLVAFTAYAMAALHVRGAVAVAACCAVALAAAAAARVKPRDIARVLVPLAPVVVFTAVMQVLCIQEGAALAQVGPVAVTDRALAESARMAAVLACLMAASVSFMCCTAPEQLVDALARLLAPLRALGVRTEGVVLSLVVAFRFAPVLVGEFRQLRDAQMSRGASFDGGVRERVRSHARLFAPLVRSSFNHADALAEAFCARCFGAPARSPSADPPRAAGAAGAARGASGPLRSRGR